MNFGERLKQIRAGRGQTQPQFAEVLGIEQSYLSKLENDKSVPSAEMFLTIVSGLGMQAADFLKEIDKEVLDTTLNHIPAVSQFTTQTVAVQAHNTKVWMYGSGVAWIIGFALMLAANDGIFFPNKLYKYASPGVIQAGEPENIFETHEDIVELQWRAKIVSSEEANKQRAEFKAKRERPVKVETTDNRGGSYAEPADNGHRRFELVKTEHIKTSGNRILQFLGATIFVAGLVGVLTEWRLRRLKNKRN
ncbi:helix-turn-helix domain-containing protein [Pseudoduganella sp. OTU4001]|uniref:helix-turn-helix domain-containing protein n=1 Tax=Pseudoduganella sp. OTU4001 TaxID=3043854 RepID=UPI00313D82E7